MIDCTVALPVHPSVERIQLITNSPAAHSSASSYAAHHAVRYERAYPVIEISPPDDAWQDPAPTATPKPADTNSPTSDAQAGDKQTFWERVFRIAPVRKRLEKVLADEWKFTDIRSRQIEWLLSEEGEEARYFFLSGSNARQYHRLVKEFGIGFETRSNKVVDESFDTLNEYGPELMEKYYVLMEHREIIKKYFAGVFRDGRISTQSLIRIGNSVWFGPFTAPKFRQYAAMLNTTFQVPNHVVGPMLASVGDSFWLRQVMWRKTAPQEFAEILKKIAPSTEGSGNAFAPALQLLVIGEEHKLTFNRLLAFLDELKLQPKDFAAFSAIEYNLGAYRLAEEIKCPTFAQYLRQLLDEYGQDINQESARLFLTSFREFKDNGEALENMLSPKYNETKAFIKTVGTINTNVWNMQRITTLTQTLTPKKREKVTYLARELATELSVADVMFLSDIADNEEETKLLLDRQRLIAGVKDIPIDRVVERSHNDLIKELEREIDQANRNGLYRTVRHLRNMMDKEKSAYTERVDPSKMTNIQLSRLLIFHRSIAMPGFLDTVGWNVSSDLQNTRAEGGGYLGYDKDMAMVTMVPSEPGDNRQYRPHNLNRASASLALFHNHAFTDTFAQKYFGFVGKIFPFLGPKKDKDPYAGPSGWLGASKGDISAAAESELPSFIITKIGHPQNADGTKDNKHLLVNFDWVVVDKQNGEALRSDRGVFKVPFFGEAELGKLKWPSKKELKRRDLERREKCPAILKAEAR